MRIAFVIGKLSAEALDEGQAIAGGDWEFLAGLAARYKIDAELILALQDERWAVPGSKPTIAAMREERERLLADVAAFAPDAVLAFGVTPLKVLHGKGAGIKTADMRRLPQNIDGCACPVHATFGLEEASFKPGLKRWIELDVRAMLSEAVPVQLGDYPVSSEMLHDYFKAEVVGFDLETFPGLNPWAPDARIRMAVVSDQQGFGQVIPATATSEFPEWFQNLLSSNVRKVGSNIKFDYIWCRRFGLLVNNIGDTSLAAHVHDENDPQKDLKSLSLIYRPELGDYSKAQRDMVAERGGPKIGWAQVRDEEMYTYAGCDGDASYTSYTKLYQHLRDDNLVPQYELLTKLNVMLAEMEYAGARIDLGINKMLDAEYSARLASVRAEITAELGPINPNSVPQLANALKGLVPDINLRKFLASKDNDDESTEAAILRREASKHPIIAKVLDYRKLAILHRNYIKGIHKHISQFDHGLGVVRTSLRADVTHTYRLSSSRPNLQNVSRKPPDGMEDLYVKRQYVSRFPGGCILEADESQVEVRIAAHVSGDIVLIEALCAGGDIYRQIAGRILNKRPEAVTDSERTKFKTVCLATLYGAGPTRIAAVLGCSKDEASRLIGDFYARFVGLELYIQGVKSSVKGTLQVKSLFGFPRRFAAPKYWNCKEGWRIERQAVNAPIQNAGAVITYLAMLGARDAFYARGLRSIIWLQIHDSIVADIYPGELEEVASIFKENMEHPPYGIIGPAFASFKLSVPLVCDQEVGETWGQLQKYVIGDGNLGAAFKYIERNR